MGATGVIATSTAVGAIAGATGSASVYATTQAFHGDQITSHGLTTAAVTGAACGGIASFAGSSVSTAMGFSTTFDFVGQPMAYQVGDMVAVVTNTANTTGVGAVVGALTETGINATTGIVGSLQSNSKAVSQNGGKNN